MWLLKRHCGMEFEVVMILLWITVWVVVWIGSSCQTNTLRHVITIDFTKRYSVPKAKNTIFAHSPSNTSKGNFQPLLGFTTRLGGCEAAAFSSFSKSSGEISKTSGDQYFLPDLYPIWVKHTIKVLDDARTCYTLRQNNRLKTSSQRLIRNVVIILTPRWTCHDIITCAGVIPSLQAISFTWEHTSEDSKIQDRAKISRTSGTARVSLTCLLLPSGEYASSKRLFSFDH